MSTSGERHLTIHAVARRLGVDVPKLRSLIGSGVLPAPQMVGVGLRQSQVFTETYVRRAKKLWADHCAEKGGLSDSVRPVWKRHRGKTIASRMKMFRFAGRDYVVVRTAKDSEGHLGVHIVGQEEKLKLKGGVSIGAMGIQRSGISGPVEKTVHAMRFSKDVFKALSPGLRDWTTMRADKLVRDASVNAQSRVRLIKGLRTGR